MKKGNPRQGSMQVWPRKRAKRPYARVRYMPPIKDAKLVGFAGYKAGMTHVSFVDNHKTSTTAKQEITVPVTIIECPPLKVYSVSFYKNTPKGLSVSAHIVADSLDKELSRKIVPPKKKAEGDKFKGIEFDELRLVVYTQPKVTGIGKKKPELFEVAVGGSKEEQLAYAQEKLGKEITIEEVFNPGDQVDIHAVTKGKGYQGPVKRFGVSLRAKKSEKTKRGPGSLGGWKGHGHFMYRIAYAGQMGFHQRTEYNKWVLKMGKADELQIAGGIPRYGQLKTTYILLKGSVGGAKKRLIRFNHATRPSSKIPKDAPNIEFISTSSMQK